MMNCSRRDPDFASRSSGLRVAAGACATTAATRWGSLWWSSRCASRCCLVPGGLTPSAASMPRSSSEVTPDSNSASGGSRPNGVSHACRNGAVMQSVSSSSGQTSA